MISIPVQVVATVVGKTIIVLNIVSMNIEMKIKTEVFVGGLTDSQKDLLKSIVDFGSPYEMGDEVVELFEEVLYRSSNE